ncbi:MAG: hypothetical protein JOZ98_14095 [Solirubrobacterales bacterium]|nr:hypothetical protein [Solirubrobacterales bacterium]MBV9424042.1 hypothetical protein [Solirubrobacterales bacterium]MBV9799530.1 hypothetical protein [Solirubrobacterales bacterium]
MLLRHRPPHIDDKPVTVTKGFEHLSDEWIAVLRWLKASRVEFVLVGPAAEAVRGNVLASGPVAIVPAPYRRNFERLARTLTAAHACLRMDTGVSAGDQETAQVKLTGEKLARGQRWTLRCGTHDLDIEARPEGVPSYQELLYEAGRYQLSADLSVDVASPEDIEHFDHVRRTGTTPEIRITRVG